MRALVNMCFNKKKKKTRKDNLIKIIVDSREFKVQSYFLDCRVDRVRGEKTKC